MKCVSGLGEEVLCVVGTCAKKVKPSDDTFSFKIKVTVLHLVNNTNTGLCVLFYINTWD